MSVKNVKNVSKNKLLWVVLSLGLVCVLGYVINELNLGGNSGQAERSLASNGFSFDKELSDLASRRVIQQVQSGRGVELGSSPSELERFLFEDLKGEFSLEVEPQKAFRLSLLNDRNSTVLVTNQHEFVKEALGFLFEDQDSYHLIQKEREPASSNLTSNLIFNFEIVDEASKTQAKVTIELTKTSHLKSLIARVLK